MKEVLFWVVVCFLFLLATACAKRYRRISIARESHEDGPGRSRRTP